MYTKKEKQFIDLLTNCNVYRQYMHNLAYAEKGRYSFFSFTYDTHHEDWLSMAFHWAKSKEGHNYWKIINDEWQKLLT
jgi:hypothetical protein